MMLVELGLGGLKVIKSSEIIWPVAKVKYIRQSSLVFG
jgi:hypothetical protein